MMMGCSRSPFLVLIVVGLLIAGHPAARAVADPTYDAFQKKLNARAVEWTRAFPFNDPFIFHGLLIVTNDWEPGKTSARLTGILSLRNRTTNSYERLGLTLTINPRTFQVTSWSTDRN